MSFLLPLPSPASCRGTNYPSRILSYAQPGRVYVNSWLSGTLYETFTNSVVFEALMRDCETSSTFFKTTKYC